jgi:hypothetical protein
VALLSVGHERVDDSVGRVPSISASHPKHLIFTQSSFLWIFS